MCGILGHISKHPLDALIFQTALSKLMHRGPDAVGIWKSDDNLITLGHQRLSILDLSEMAAQPMATKDLNLVITFNGEIYNYKEIRNELEKKGYTFKSKSDTEVILHAWREWGIAAIQKFQGMFAFAIYDAIKQKLILVRDRVGEKPLFYSLLNNSFSFSSELKALLPFQQHNPKVNHQAMNCLLGMGYVPRDLCIFDGYHKLNPAHYLEYDLISGQHQIHQYWELPQYQDRHQNEEQLAEELDILLANAVKKQLEADVPVGVLLSGGLDSSLITAYAASFKKDIKTFTVSFPGYGQSDEASFAKSIANHFGTTHIELETETANPELLFLLSHQMDEPMTDPSMVPTFLLSKKIKEYCTVALGGDGGDELFGGYNRYQQWLQMQKIWGKVPFSFRKKISSFATTILPDGFRGKHYLQQIVTDFKHALPMEDALFDIKKRRIIANGFLQTFPTSVVKKEFMQESATFAERAMRADFHSYLPDDVLVKVDRASMLASLEVRAPILDIPIVEFAFAQVPSSLKVTTKSKKILLKKVAKNKLPKNFDFNRKQGFVPPLELWMKEKKWEEFFKDHLFNKKNSWWNSKAIESLWAGQQKGHFNKGRLFTLLMIELWKKEYGVEL